MFIAENWLKYYPVRGEFFVNPVNKKYRIHELLVKRYRNLLDTINVIKILMCSWVRYIQPSPRLRRHHERDNIFLFFPGLTPLFFVLIIAAPLHATTYPPI